MYARRVETQMSGTRKQTWIVQGTVLVQYRTNKYGWLAINRVSNPPPPHPIPSGQTSSHLHPISSLGCKRRERTLRDQETRQIPEGGSWVQTSGPRQVLAWLERAGRQARPGQQEEKKKKKKGKEERRGKERKGTQDNNRQAKQVEKQWKGGFFSPIISRAFSSLGLMGSVGQKEKY